MVVTAVCLHVLLMAALVHVIQICVTLSGCTGVHVTSNVRLRAHLPTQVLRVKLSVGIRQLERIRLCVKHDADSILRILGHGLGDRMSKTLVHSDAIMISLLLFAFWRVPDNR